MVIESNQSYARSRTPVTGISALARWFVGQPGIASRSEEQAGMNQGYFLTPRAKFFKGSFRIAIQR